MQALPWMLAQHLLSTASHLPITLAECAAEQMMLMQSRVLLAPFWVWARAHASNENATYVEVCVQA